MEKNLLDDSVFTAEDLHKLVGLFRARISNVMQMITDVRKEYRAVNRTAPPELSPVMVRAQEDFADLLKLSDVCWKAREGEIELRQAAMQADVVFSELFLYFEWLRELDISNFRIEESVFEAVEDIRMTFDASRSKW